MSKACRIIGKNAFIKALNNQTKQVDRAVSQEINRSALRTEKRAKQLAPWDTGWMSNTVYSWMTQILRAEIISPAVYSIYVEDGTRNMAAQPFMGPALKAEYPLLMKNLNKLIRG
ncbi:HK97-gp10 family putative phage morphogenesis protein [Enterococcus sp. DIV0800]|uniref:HK97-gp10 family putative phage morphogenesis protein n=1 Tax=unclassified Enterococcus TaxID=2608891 RepID=UPI003D2FD37D